MAEPVASAWLADALELDQKLTVSEWSDEYRVLSTKAAAEPGRWRTSRTPYLREILDALSPDSPVTDLWVIKGAQLGFTECGINWVGSDDSTHSRDPFPPGLISKARSACAASANVI